MESKNALIRLSRLRIEFQNLWLNAHATQLTWRLSRMAYDKCGKTLKMLMWILTVALEHLCELVTMYREVVYVIARQEGVGPLSL